MHMPYCLFKYEFILLLCFIICGCSKREVIEQTYENGNPRKGKIYRRWLFAKKQKAVEYIEYHYNHHPKFQAALKDEQYCGPSSSWWLNGHLRSKGNYRRGKREGKWKFFFEKNGALSSRGLYLSGKKQGRWEEFWPGGQTKSRGAYLEGGKAGLWINLDSAGRIQSRNSCFEPNDTGTYVSYYPQDSIFKQYTCIRGKRAGLYLVKSPKGGLLEKGHYNAGHRKEGLWRAWHVNGAQKYHEYYANGLRHGTSRSWDSLGNQLSQGDFREGTGELKRYRSNGVLLAKEPYVKGKKHGGHFTYYSSGSINTRTVFKKGRPCSYSRWHDSPRGREAGIAITGGFREGKRHGLWNWYSKEGVLVESSSYVNGKRHGPTKYFDAKTGKLQRVQVFDDGVETTATLAPR